MRYILTGAAVIALAASGAHAQPGKGNGNGNGKPAAAAKANDNGNARPANRGGNAKPDKRGNVRAAQNGQGNGKNNNANRGKRDNGNSNRSGRKAQKANRDDQQRIERRVDRVQERRYDQRDERRDDRVRERRYDQRDQRRNDRIERRGDTRVRYIDRSRYADDRRFFSRDRSRNLIDGCPPGLAKKRNGCQPPGQARKNRGNWDRYYDRSIFGYSYRPRLFGLTNYGSGNYYYNDGYLLRRSGSDISGYIPLLGGALATGNPWPQSYDYFPVSEYHVDYYNLGSRDRYRYADNVIYRVDPEDAAIRSVAALLTGDDIAIGQPMPRGYDVYNVPYGYRDRYYDTPEANYRYSDGYVYQIDPTTQLVAAAIDLLV